MQSETTEDDSRLSPPASRLAPSVVDETRRMIREIKDPVELQEQLREMLEEAHPVAIFNEDEAMPFAEFERRFKRSVCGGNETRFAQWEVRILKTLDGELCLALGTSAEGKTVISAT